MMVVEDLGNGATKEVTDDGTFWHLNGLLHRIDGPAFEGADGSKWWYVKGKRHRIEGPAIENWDGYKAWFLKGEFMTEDEHKQRTKGAQ